jgi:hypothetical protein
MNQQNDTRTVNVWNEQLLRLKAASTKKDFEAIRDSVVNLTDLTGRQREGLIARCNHAIQLLDNPEEKIELSKYNQERANKKGTK